MSDRPGFALSVDADGAPVVEVTSREPFGPRPSREGEMLAPAEYLAEAELVTLMVSGDSTESGPQWRWIEVDVPTELPWVRTHRRPIDLSQGSDDRRFLEALVARGSMRIVWRNEELETVQSIESRRTVYEELLANTAGMDAAAWQAELDVQRENQLSGHGVWPRPKRRRRRTAEPPARPIPFFATRSGALPRTGRATVADERLPRGARHPQAEPSFWVTEEPVPDAAAICDRLAAAFPETGLWPLCWAVEGGAEGHLHGARDVNEVDGALPDGIGGVDVAGGALLAPTAAFAETIGDEARPIVLVPCNRPADVPAMTGFDTIDIEPVALSAGLRSWEERFAAVLVALAPGVLTLAVGSGPATLDAAREVIAEFDSAGVANPDGASHAERAAALLGGQQVTSLYAGPRRWELFIE